MLWGALAPWDLVGEGEGGAQQGGLAPPDLTGKLPGHRHSTACRTPASTQYATSSCGSGVDNNGQCDDGEFGLNAAAVVVEAAVVLISWRGLMSWIRQHSGSCKDLNRNRGGSGKTPNAVQNCGPDGRISLGASRGAKQGGSGWGRFAAPGCQCLTHTCDRTPHAPLHCISLSPRWIPAPQRTRRRLIHRANKAVATATSNETATNTPRCWLATAAAAVASAAGRHQHKTAHTDAGA
jgi:hypothetical protein